jgi:uncharacterized protein YciW
MIEETMTANLVLIARAYAKGKRTTLAAVARKLYGNPRLFAELQTRRKPTPEDPRKWERSISVQKYEWLIDRMKSDWPESVIFPLTRAVIIERYQRPG